MTTPPTDVRVVHPQAGDRLEDLEDHLALSGRRTSPRKRPAPGPWSRATTRCEAMRFSSHTKIAVACARSGHLDIQESLDPQAVGELVRELRYVVGASDVGHALHPRAVLGGLLDTGVEVADHRLARITVSPSSSSNSRNTPCVEGCCGPMLMIMVSWRYSPVTGSRKASATSPAASNAAPASSWRPRGLTPSPADRSAGPMHAVEPRRHTSRAARSFRRGMALPVRRQQDPLEIRVAVEQRSRRSQRSRARASSRWGTAGDRGTWGSSSAGPTFTRRRWSCHRQQLIGEPEPRREPGPMGGAHREGSRAPASAGRGATRVPRAAPALDGR